MEELNTALESIMEMTEEKEAENSHLSSLLKVLEEEVNAQGEELGVLVRMEEEERAKVRMMRMMKKNRLTEQLRDQTELLNTLRLQIQSFANKTYPTLKRKD